ncbi:hypothetical protein D3C71_1691520 [compost metagenome]
MKRSIAALLQCRVRCVEAFQYPADIRQAAIVGLGTMLLRRPRPVRPPRCPPQDPEVKQELPAAAVDPLQLRYESSRFTILSVLDD